MQPTHQDFVNNCFDINATTTATCLRLTTLPPAVSRKTIKGKSV